MSLSDRLREALRNAPALPPLEGDLPEERALANVPAAVLIGVTRREEPGLILTVRREHMRTHAGQVAFPGGRIDSGGSWETLAYVDGLFVFACRPYEGHA